ncbi:hypothetical protein [Duganella sp. P38]|uniref:hypothetical protein n=1 Tax=Duganella sp. P38 TaxID=3423949 RepID=UPI003D793697
MMRRPSLTAASLLAAALLMLAAAPAQAQVALGRLFATPAERAAMEANRGAAAAPAQNPDGMQPPPGMPADPAGQEAAATSAPPPPPPSLVMSGVLRRSGSRDTTVWLNGEPQYGAQGNLSQRKGAATPNLTVTLPSGKRVTLKPGQRYDLNEGRVKDINEP